MERAPRVDKEHLKCTGQCAQSTVLLNNYAQEIGR